MSCLPFRCQGDHRLVWWKNQWQVQTVWVLFNLWLPFRSQGLLWRSCQHMECSGIQWSSASIVLGGDLIDKNRFRLTKLWFPVLYWRRTTGIKTWENRINTDWQDIRFQEPPFPCNHGWGYAKAHWFHLGKRDPDTGFGSSQGWWHLWDDIRSQA